MAESKAQKTADSLATLPTAKEVMKQIALKEAEKASAAARELSAAEAEKKALIEKFSKASGVFWISQPKKSLHHPHHQGGNSRTGHGQRTGVGK